MPEEQSSRPIREASKSARRVRFPRGRGGGGRGSSVYMNHSKHGHSIVLMVSQGDCDCLGNCI